MRISDAITAAARVLAMAGVENPRREASSLMAFAIDKDTAHLIAHPEQILTEAENLHYIELVERRSRREPFHLISGHREFFGLDFEVEMGVLVPRPETEILVEAAIDSLSTRENPSFCELGVGTGCIAVSILHNVPRAECIATDISIAALRLAGRNARHHDVLERLELFEADLFGPIADQFDLIVSNPPYIPDAELAFLAPEVAAFDPHSALFGGPDGLSIINRIVALSPSYLKKEGTLVMEIGFGQQSSVKDLFDGDIWQAAEFLNDLQGIPRVVRARLAKRG